MNVTGAHIIGMAFLAVLFYGLALLVLRRQPKQIRWFAIALCTVGLGYLAMTRAPVDVAKLIFGAPM